MLKAVGARRRLTGDLSVDHNRKFAPLPLSPLPSSRQAMIPPMNYLVRALPARCLCLCSLTFRRTAAALLAVACTVLTVREAAVAQAEVDGPATEKAGSQTIDVSFFESKIRPVLVEHCYECHSAESKPLQAGLRLDFREGLQTGGDSGSALDAEHPEASLLLKALRYDGIEMPPKGKLPPAVVADFEKWLLGGTPDPRDEPPSAARIAVDMDKATRWWAFQKVTRPAIPEQTENLPSHYSPSQPLDRFIDQALAKAGLEPAAEADRYALLRRLRFDLTGLPPSVEEVDSFASDGSPDAVERLVDRLLASPAYGQRWGRMWLDAARYADSNGADENHTFPVAWKYRDYVVRAFNSDLPYDRFITEQLAGDLLPSNSPDERTELWTATGFLIIGPKMLAEQDKPKMLADIVDEQVDTVGQALLGMTLGCARCHDHKFDPILAKDYYALSGIFHSTKTMAHTEFVSQWNERDLPDPEKQKEVDAFKIEVDTAKADLKELVSKALKTAKKKKESELTDEQRKPLSEARKKIEEMEKSAPKMPSVMAADEAPVKTVPIHIRGNHLQLGPEPIPRAVPGIFASTTKPPEFPADASGRLELAQWLTSVDHPLTARVLVNRIWQGHFGEGLVRTPANFGLTGEQPTHPELLDYLTSELVDGHWSVKRLHRTIVLSSAYRRSSVVPLPWQQKDLENRWFSRQNRRRLEVEPLRDAILALGDNIDTTIGGQAEAAYGNFETTQAPRGIEGSLRRTIYLPVNRAALSELLSTFDYVDSAVSVARRSSTVVPHQSLFLMNNPLVLEQALLFSRRVQSHSQEDAICIDYAVRLAFGRPADPSEVAAALTFLNSAGGLPPESLVSTIGQGDKPADTPVPADTTELERTRARAWHRFCLSLMCANEFLTID